MTIFQTYCKDMCLIFLFVIEESYYYMESNSIKKHGKTVNNSITSIEKCISRLL